MPRLAALVSALLLPCALMAAPLPADGEIIHPESRLVAALDNISEGRLNDALNQLDELIRDEPTFKAAQLLYGDLMQARAGPKNRKLKSRDAESTALIEEARLRWQHGRNAVPDGALPDSLLQLDAEQRHFIVADLERSRLYVFENENGRPRLIDHFYASIGKNGYGKQVEGDARTPVGVYHVTSYLPGATLPDLYGEGAFPVNYPNAWDNLKGKTGYGIWLHGVPQNTYSRPPRSSEGCLALANADLVALKPYIQAGSTPVILSDGLNWVAEAELAEQRKQFSSVLDSWRRDWESRDTDAYLSHYSGELRAGNMNYSAFARHKQRVNRNKTFISVELDDLSVFRYPGDEELVYAVFTQKYRSSNYNGTSRKQQYWRNEDGRWKIVYEDRF